MDPRARQSKAGNGRGLFHSLFAPPFSQLFFFFSFLFLKLNIVVLHAGALFLVASSFSISSLVYLVCDSLTVLIEWYIRVSGPRKVFDDRGDQGVPLLWYMCLLDLDVS